MTYLTDIQQFPDSFIELGRLLSQPIFYGRFIQDINEEFFLHGKLTAKLPLKQNIEVIVEDHNNRQYGLARLAMFILDLQQIEIHSEQILQYFQKIYKRVTPNEYYGFRLEVDITATLINKDITFKNEMNDETFGDIRITETLPNVFLECTSCHIDKHKFSSFLYKIKSAIHKKQKKPYCNEHTALLIDVTNIFFARSIIHALISNQELDSCMKDIQRRLSFGSIILFVYLINRDRREHRFQNLYFRYDQPKISSELRFTLDKAFPIGSFSQPLFKVSFTGNY